MNVLGSFSAHDDVVAVFDIGSGSVGAAVVARGDEENPARILAGKRLVLSHEERDEKQRLAGIIRLLREAGEQVVASYAKQTDAPPIASSIAVIHAPWVETRTSKAVSKLKRSVEITEAVINEVSHRALTTDDVPERSQIFERSIVRVELNGYPTPDPVGKTAQHIAATVLQSAASKGLVQAIEEITASLLPGRPLSMRSATLASAVVLRKIAQRTENYVMLDMTSEVSACTVFRGGDVTHHAIVPVGTRTLLHRLAKKTGAPPDEVRSRIRMAAEDECADGVCTQVEQALAEIEPEFLKAFGETLSTIASDRRIPNMLVVAVPDDLAPWAVSFLGRLDFGQFTITGKPFVVQRISAAALAPYAVLAAGVQPDAGIAAAAAFVHIRT